MNSARQTAGARAVLPYIGTFHRLKLKRLCGEGLTIAEARTLDRIVELFEPRRVSGAGLRRESVKLRVDRRARLSFAGRTVGATVKLVSLRKATVTSDELPTGGQAVELMIESACQGVWFRFRGSVSSVSPRAHSAVVTLDRPHGGMS